MPLAELIEVSADFPEVALHDTLHEMLHDLEARVAEIGYTLEDYLRLQGTTRDAYETEMRPAAERRLKGRLVIDDMWREATLYPAGEPVKAVYTNPVFGGYRDFDDTFRERLSCFVRQVADGVDPVLHAVADVAEDDRRVQQAAASLGDHRQISWKPGKSCVQRRDLLVL